MFVSQKNKYNFFLVAISIILYLSLLFGFFFDENLNFGSIQDWDRSNRPVIDGFFQDFKHTFFNYDDFKHRHSPIYLIFLSFIKSLGISFDLIRLFNLHISIILIYSFYKCLTIKFEKVDTNLLGILSVVIFLSPTFRSLSIWPDSRIIGLTFFVISIYQILKFQQKNKEINFWKSLFLLVASAYISPNFSIFALYHLFILWDKKKNNTLIYTLIFLIVLSTPALFYIFVLDINFITSNAPAESAGATALSFNFANKILIIGSIILFHLIPFLINKDFLSKLYKFTQKNFFLILIFLIINVFFFNYNLNFTGGGAFFQISNIFFKNNLIFFPICFLSFILIGFFIKNNLNNFIIFFILIISNIQNTIYHKYYDPLIMILFFTILNNSLAMEFFKENKNLFFVYSFYIFYIAIRLVKNHLI